MTPRSWRIWPGLPDLRRRPVSRLECRLLMAPRSPCARPARTLDADLTADPKSPCRCAGCPARPILFRGAVSESGRLCRGDRHRAWDNRRWRVLVLAILSTHAGAEGSHRRRLCEAARGSARLRRHASLSRPHPPWRPGRRSRTHRRGTQHRHVVRRVIRVWVGPYRSAARPQLAREPSTRPHTLEAS